MKKEEIAVKLTKKNISKVVKILNEYEQKLITPIDSSLKINNDNHRFLYYSTPEDGWVHGIGLPYSRTLIKPKQLKELLENEPFYSSKYLVTPIWQESHRLGSYATFDQSNGTNHDCNIGNMEYVPISEFTMTKDGIGDKGTEYIPEKKTLEVGKWYKYPNLLAGRFMFMFMGEFVCGKTVGFDSEGKYCNDLGIYENQVPKYTEAKPEEVIEAFIYHMDTFANKRKDIKTPELLDILNQLYREEISFGKVVELINKGAQQ